jgi:hypothetical protein
MTKIEKEVSTKKEEIPLQDEEMVKININELYKFDPKDMTPDISIVRYSNMAYIQVTGRDVYIDFLEMPGIKKEGKVLLNGTRIYMSFVAAKSLAEALLGVLEQVHSGGRMEKYISKDEKQEESNKLV